MGDAMPAVDDLVELARDEVASLRSTPRRLEVRSDAAEHIIEANVPEQLLHGLGAGVPSCLA